MDVDNMAGSTLQAMANAVEEADLVLVCFSQKYKNSQNCRAGKPRPGSGSDQSISAS